MQEYILEGKTCNGGLWHSVISFLYNILLFCWFFLVSLDFADIVPDTIFILLQKRRQSFCMKIYNEKMERITRSPFLKAPISRRPLGKCEL